MLHGFDQVITLWAFYLAVTGASGQTLSLDRFRRRKADPTPPPPTISANLALRGIQIHLCVIYATAGLAKLQGEAWWNGTAVALLLGNSDFRPFDLTWLALFPQVINLATHLTVAFEITYPILIWNRWFRPLYLVAAIALHLGIAVVMGLAEFAVAMIIGNLAFVSASTLRAFLPRIHVQQPTSRVKSKK
jgi:hypothetical protein